MRTIHVIVFSLLLGVLVGVSSVWGVNILWPWNPQREFQHGSTQATTKIDAMTEAAKIQVDEYVYDFGIMYTKDKGRHTFTVKNVGTADLTLLANATSCQCTGIDIEPKRVPAGGTAAVTLRWDADRAMESFKQSASVLTNDATNPEVYFTIQGLFVYPVKLYPNLLTFPSVRPNTETTGSLRIYGFESSPPLEITEVLWEDKEHFDVTIASGVLSDADKQHQVNQRATAVYDVKVAVKSGLPLGPFLQRITFKTNYPSAPSEELTLRGQVSVGGISISGKGYDRTGGFWDFGTVSRNEKLQQSLRILLTGARASQTTMTVEDVYPKWLQVSVDTAPLGDNSATTGLAGTVAAGSVVTITATVPAGSPVGTHRSDVEQSSGRIVLKTDNPDLPELRIPIQLNIVP